MTLYLFALPLTLIHLGWAMIPIVTVVAFTFMGIEGIADEIEMPFGTFTFAVQLAAPLKTHRYWQTGPTIGYVVSIIGSVISYRC